MVLEDPELKDLDGDPLHLGEIQALGEQVVGPGSLHPNGNKISVSYRFMRSDDQTLVKT